MCAFGTALLKDCAIQDIQSNLHGINNTSILAARRGFPPSAVELRDYVASRRAPLKEPRH
ncbi:MAG: hypothetical protein H6729_08710 [Deltaproteobacteria bacterium]|nr:hypothetical protein [Deltaproteobacteria bacterium]